MTQIVPRQVFFLILLVVITLAFGWVLLPYAGAIFWSTVLAILFAPLQRRMLKATGNKHTMAALASLFLIIVMVIFPLSLIGASLVRQAAEMYGLITSGKIDFAAQFQHILHALPQWVIALLEQYDLANLAALQAKLAAAAAEVSQLAAKYAFSAGRNTFNFVLNVTIMLYLLFFLLRDGKSLAARIRSVVPLSNQYKERLFTNFTTVIRATVRGNVLVAVAQGALGGLIFWFLDVQAALLWAVVMAFLSLLPAVGAAIVWAPVAAYFLLTGALWEGLGLFAYGVLVIGMVDNFLRPILVGKDTKLPDYLVLLSTIGGMALFGLSGFVIGPVIAALFIAVWHLFATADEFHG